MTPRPILASETVLQPAVAQAEYAAQLPILKLDHFRELVALASEKRDLQLKAALERDVRLVSFEDGKFSFALSANGQRTLPNELTRKLKEWTGRSWAIIIANEEGQPTLREQASGEKQRRESDALTDPLVQAVLSSFPGARIVDVRERGETTEITHVAREHAQILAAPIEAGDEDAEWGEEPYMIDEV
jgi:DNA polymerase III subunit gamma/tau